MIKIFQKNQIPNNLNFKEIKCKILFAIGNKKINLLNIEFENTNVGKCIDMAIRRIHNLFEKSDPKTVKIFELLIETNPTIIYVGKNPQDFVLLDNKSPN